jgi:hypothetical protein
MRFTDTFHDRAKSAAAAKQKNLESLRARTLVDPEELARRKEARLAREAEEEAARAAKKAEIEAARAAAEQEKADRLAAEQAEKEAAKAKLAESLRVPTEAERKAARDARYAARKARVRG